jgi:hypothetical protein
MTKVEELKVATKRLPLEELEIFQEWLEEYLASLWDAQIEADIREGKLDALAKEAIQSFNEGDYTEL